MGSILGPPCFGKLPFLKGRHSYGLGFRVQGLGFRVVRFGLHIRGASTSFQVDDDGLSSHKTESGHGRRPPVVEQKGPIRRKK